MLNLNRNFIHIIKMVKIFKKEDTESGNKIPYQEWGLGGHFQDGSEGDSKTVECSVSQTLSCRETTQDLFKAHSDSVSLCRA